MAVGIGDRLLRRFMQKVAVIQPGQLIGDGKLFQLLLLFPHRVEQMFRREQIGHAGAQLLLDHRLGDVVIRALAQDLDAPCDIVQPGNRQHRNTVALVLQATDLPQQSDTAQRTFDQNIGDDQIVILDLELFPSQIGTDEVIDQQTHFLQQLHRDFGQPSGCLPRTARAP